MTADDRARPTVKPDITQRAPAVRQQPPDTPSDLVLDSVVSEPLRAAMTSQPDSVIGVLIELRTSDGVGAARARLAALATEVTGTEGRIEVDRRSPYVTLALTSTQITSLVEADGRSAAAGQEPASTASSRAPRGCIHRIWPNFEITGLMLRSGQATKCAPAQRTFDARGQGIVWAVLDSGIHAEHLHFQHHANLRDLPAGVDHASFIGGQSDPLVDENGHGTHVAGIVAGGLEPGVAATGVGWYRDAAGNDQRQTMQVTGISGMAPQCKLLSCQVLRADRTGDVTALLDALLYIQEINEHGSNIRVHGVNISVGHPFDPAWFAAGRTPVCREVDRLVRSGVVVVVAAGNTGYGYAQDPNGRAMRLGFDTTINDPGNAEEAITVGATSSTPHTTGVSYFSSKGPTGDGRMKPDLVAPGERVISAAAGKLLEQAQRADPNAAYIESSGTSMAAPHVSGAAAGFLSVKQELIGRPDQVKQVLMDSATDLGRSRIFQGAGMLDAMRALQAL